MHHTVRVDFPPELPERPSWSRTGDPYFPAAAVVGGRQWVLRLNCFPDHALWTLFVDGAGRFSIDDVPEGWGQPSDRSAPLLPPEAAEAALAPIRTLVAYGSEAGQPCDNLFCCADLPPNE